MASVPPKNGEKQGHGACWSLFDLVGKTPSDGALRAHPIAYGMPDALGIGVSYSSSRVFRAGQSFTHSADPSSSAPIDTTKKVEQLRRLLLHGESMLGNIRGDAAARRSRQVAERGSGSKGLAAAGRAPAGPRAGIWARVGCGSPRHVGSGTRRSALLLRLPSWV